MKQLIDALLIIHFDSKNDFANKINYSKDRIARFKSGSVIPSKNFLSNICNAYNISPRKMQLLINKKGSTKEFVLDILNYYRKNKLFPDIVKVWSKCNVDELDRTNYNSPEDMYHFLHLVSVSLCLNSTNLCKILKIRHNTLINMFNSTEYIDKNAYLIKLSSGLNIDLNIIYKWYLDSYKLGDYELVYNMLKYYKNNNLFGFSQSEEYKQGHVLRLIRHIKGINKEEIAKKTGITFSYIRQLETKDYIDEKQFNTLIKSYGINNKELKLLRSSNSKMELLYNAIVLFKLDNTENMLFKRRQYQYIDYKNNNYYEYYSKAMNGDIKARQMIYALLEEKINKYCEILIKGLNKLYSKLSICSEIYIDSEDIKQDMYLYLWEKINIYFNNNHKSLLTIYLDQLLDRYVTNKIEKISKFINKELIYISDENTGQKTSYDELALIYENKEKIAEIITMLNSNSKLSKYAKIMELLEKQYDYEDIAKKLEISYHNAVVSTSNLKKYVKEHVK